MIPIKKLIFIFICFFSANTFAQFDLLPSYTKKKVVLIALTCSDFEKISDGEIQKTKYISDIISYALTRSGVYLEVEVCQYDERILTMKQIDYLSSDKIDSPSNKIFENEKTEQLFKSFLNQITITHDTALKSIHGNSHSLYIYTRSDRHRGDRDGYGAERWKRNYELIPATQSKNLVFLSFIIPFTNYTSYNSEYRNWKNYWFRWEADYDPYISFLHPSEIFTLPFSLSLAQMQIDDHKNLYLSKYFVDESSKIFLDFNVQIKKYLNIQNMVVLQTKADESDLDTVIKLFKNKVTGKVEALLSVSPSNSDDFEKYRSVDEYNRKTLRDNQIRFREIPDAGTYSLESSNEYVFNYVNSLILDEDTVLIPNYIKSDEVNSDDIPLLPKANNRAQSLYQGFFKNVIPISIPPLTGSINCVTADIPEM